MSTKIQCELTQKASEKIATIKEKLANRGVKRAKIPQLINDLLEKLSDTYVDHYVEKNTPLEWKLKELMQSDQGRKKLEGVIKAQAKQKNTGKINSLAMSHDE